MVRIWDSFYTLPRLSSFAMEIPGHGNFILSPSLLNFLLSHLPDSIIRKCKLLADMSMPCAADARISFDSPLQYHIISIIFCPLKSLCDTVISVHSAHIHPGQLNCQIRIRLSITRVQVKYSPLWCNTPCIFLSKDSFGD